MVKTEKQRGQTPRHTTRHERQPEHAGALDSRIRDGRCAVGRMLRLHDDTEPRQGPPRIGCGRAAGDAGRA